MTSTSLDGQPASAETLKPRLAGVKDLDLLIEFGRKFHQLSPWKDTDFDSYKMKKVLLEMIADEDAIVIMHDKGVIGGSIISPYFNNTIIAQELFWYAEEDGLSLLEAFEGWAFIEGAEMVSMASTNIRPKAIERLYRQMGYTPREAFFTKDLED